MDRATFVKRATAAQIALLGALGPQGGAAAIRAAPPGPTRGGTLRIGVVGNGTSEPLDPGIYGTSIDSAHGFTIFDPLVRIGRNFNFVPGLALRWETNKTATVYEIHLRPGVRWHDGKRFTADDVIYSLRRMGRPSHFGHFAVSAVDLHGLAKRGNLVVHVPMKRPFAKLSNLFAYPPTLIVQNGTGDFTKPVGTGPFRLQSFTPGQQMVALGNTDYWDQPRPYLDQVNIISLSDSLSGYNALLGGQLDVTHPIPTGIANAKKAHPRGSSWKLLEQRGGGAQLIYMRADMRPFDDPRVRLAMKLLPDRQKMVDTVWSGLGEIANDLFGKHLPYYASSLPQRDQDLERAKSLLKSAGQSDLRVTLYTSDALAGLIDAATFYAQEAAKAGVTVKLEIVPSASYLNPQLSYLKLPFAQDSWPFISLAHGYELLAASTAPINEGHYRNPKFDALLRTAEGTLEPRAAEAAWFAAQRLFWNDSSYIVWGHRHNTSGVAANVQGTYGGWLFPTSDWRIREWWLSS